MVDDHRTIPPDDLDEMPAHVMVSVTLVVPIRIRERAIVDGVFDLAIADVKKLFRQNEFRAYVVDGFVRPVSAEELQKVIPRRDIVPEGRTAEILADLPRKLHMAQAALGRKPTWLCGAKRVAQKNIVTDEALVTCKWCQSELRKARFVPR